MKKIQETKTSKGQSMVEFALGITIFLFLIFGVLEAGYFMFVKISTEYAVRDAARYGAGMGNNSAGVPRYQDCQGIKDLLKKNAPFSGLSDSDIKIEYDSGPELLLPMQRRKEAITLLFSRLIQRGLKKEFVLLKTVSLI